MEDEDGGEDLSSSQNYSTLVKMETDVENEEEADSKDWQDGSAFLPPGWLHKTVHGHTADWSKLLAPDGTVFNSKVKALNHMMENNYSDADINRLRESFSSDGWSESDLLPPSWKFRKCKADRNEYQFIAPSGDIFNSRRGLIEYIRSDPGMTEADVANAQQLFDEIKATWVNNLQDYVEGDKSVPPGWRIKYFAGVKANGKERERNYILAPSGTRFQSRARAIQYMVENSYPRHHIDYMLSQLVAEGWVHNPKLPVNWRIKKKTHQKAAGSYLLTSEGLILTVKKAQEHILGHPETYSVEDAAAVEEVAKILTRERLEDLTEWTVTEAAPEGWTYRQVTLRNVPFKREYFRTEAGDVIKGRVAAIKHQLADGHGLEDPDILLLRLGLSGAGWSEPPGEMLPPGWLQKPIIGESKKFKYLSPEYTEFKTLVDVHQFMKSNNFGREILKKVEENLGVKEILRNKTLTKNTSNWMSHSWEDADYLPDQWKVAEKILRYNQKKYIYLSPSGFMLNKAIEALLLMIEEKVERRFLIMMSERLELDGWRSHSSLPGGWRYCQERRHFPDNLASVDTDMVYITGEHRVLTSTEAEQYIRDTRIMDVEAFLRISLELDDDKDWCCDPHLPDNWKIKEINLSNKTIFRVKSPTSTIYDSILEAYNAMIHGMDESYPQHILDKVKMKLRQEGFEEHDQLPPGWLIIRNRGDNLFELLSREGTVYQTMDSALIEMADTSQYTERDREQLEVLCLDLVEEYLSTKVRSAKGKRKGKVKQGFILKQKKRPGRKKKGGSYKMKRLKEEEDST